jgi:hypothetical protein
VVDGFVQKFMIGITTLDEGGREGGREPRILDWLFVEILTTGILALRNWHYPAQAKNGDRDLRILGIKISCSQ